MKKTLIALAALAATSAFAQSSVTMYGRMDVGYANSVATTVTNGVSAEVRNNGINSHNSVSSLWGIKGTEDLGGGMKAEFILESDVFPANGNTGVSGAAGGAVSNGAFDRTSLLGLSGGFGSLMMGRDYLPTFKLVAGTDLFGLTRLSTIQQAAGAGSTVANQIIYTTPSMGGLSAKLSVGNSDTGTTATNAVARNANLSVSYANGPLMVAVGMGTRDAVAATTNSDDVAVVAASYNFGAAKLVGNYIRNKNTPNNTIAQDITRTETNLGVAVPMGKVTLLAAYGRNTQSSTVAATAGDRSGNDWVLGADYSLSKRTALFIKTGVVAKLEGTQGAGTTINSKLAETNFGVKHTF